MAVISDPRLWELRMHDNTLYSTLINATCLPCGFCLRPQSECLSMRPLAAISKHQLPPGSFNLWTGKYADGVVEAPTPRVSLRLAIVNTSGHQGRGLEGKHVNEKSTNQEAARDTSVYVAQLTYRTAVLVDHRCNGPSMDLGELRGFAFSGLAHENNSGKLSHILP